MSPPMQTLALPAHYSVMRQIIAPQVRARIGAGAQQVRRQFQRPVYSFTLHNDQMDKASAEAFFGFAQWHQGDRPFWYAGSQWGAVETALLFGFGTGTQTQWFLPNRWITTGTLTAYVNGGATGVACDLASGLVTFGSAPADQAMLTAKYQCKYKCVFFTDGETLLNEEQFYFKLYKYGGVQLREVVP